MTKIEKVPEPCAKDVRSKQPAAVKRAIDFKNKKRTYEQRTDL